MNEHRSIVAEFDLPQVRAQEEKREGSVARGLLYAIPLSLGMWVALYLIAAPFFR